MNFISQTLLNQGGLILGFMGSLILAFSNKVGVIAKDGRIITTGLDDMSSIEERIKLVENSHWRHRYLSPIGWVMFCFSFVVQLIATLVPA